MCISEVYVLKGWFGKDDIHVVTCEKVAEKFVKMGACESYSKHDLLNGLGMRNQLCRHYLFETGEYNYENMDMDETDKIWDKLVEDIKKDNDGLLSCDIDLWEFEK